MRKKFWDEDEATIPPSKKKVLGRTRQEWKEKIKELGRRKRRKKNRKVEPDIFVIG